MDRGTAPVTFDPHVFTRQHERNFDLDFVEETVRTGAIEEDKSSPPRKFCFQRYHGKERQTYHVVTIFHEEFIEVKTTWLTKGR